MVWSPSTLTWQCLTRRPSPPYGPCDKLQTEFRTGHSTKLGGCLQTLVTNDGSPRAEVLARVSNAAQQAESSLCHGIARECAADSCALCTATTRHEDEGQSGTTPYPCEVVQAQIKLAEYDFINFLPTFLSQCMVVARDVPMGSPLLTCAEPPSLVRTLMPRLVASHDGVREEGLSVFLTGLHPSIPSVSNVQLLLSMTWMATEAFSCASGFRACMMPARGWRMYPAHRWPQSQLCVVLRGEPRRH